MWGRIITDWINKLPKWLFRFETFKSFISVSNSMVDLKWDGDVDSEDVDSEVSEVNKNISKKNKNMETNNEKDDDNKDETTVMIDETDEKMERLNKLADGEDSQKCLHEWENVSREEMTRMVNGEVIDSKDVYWCNTCKSILDEI